METTKANWDQFIQGKNDALGNLYADLFEPLVYVAYYRVKNIEIARDIVGEVFVMLLSTPIHLRKLKWPDIYTVEGYLTQMVRNKSIDVIRKTNRQLNAIEEIPQLSEVPEYFGEEVLNTLPQKEHELFQLHLNGYTNTEIASHQKLSEKTIRNKLSLIRKKMAYVYKLIPLALLCLLLN